MKRIFIALFFIIPLGAGAQRITERNLNERLIYYSTKFKEDLEGSYESKMIELIYFNYIDRMNLIKRKIKTYNQAKVGMDRALSEYYTYTLGGLDRISPAEIVTLYSYQAKFRQYYKQATEDKNELKRLLNDVENRNMCSISSDETKISSLADYFSIMFAPIALVNIPMNAVDYNSWESGTASITGSAQGDFYYEGATMAIALASPVMGATFAVIGSAIKAIKQDDLDFEARNRFLDAVNAILTYYNNAIVDLNSKSKVLVSNYCIRFYKNIAEDEETNSLKRLRNKINSFELDLIDLESSWLSMSDRVLIVESKYEQQKIAVSNYLNELVLNSNQAIQDYLTNLESEVKTQTTYYRNKIFSEIRVFKKKLSESGKLESLSSSMEKLIESTVEGDLKFYNGESDIYFRRKNTKIREIL